jgi:hypothetical protein
VRLLLPPYVVATWEYYEVIMFVVELVLLLWQVANEEVVVCVLGMVLLFARVRMVCTFAWGLTLTLGLLCVVAMLLELTKANLLVLVRGEQWIGLEDYSTWEVL